MDINPSRGKSMKKPKLIITPEIRDNYLKEYSEENFWDLAHCLVFYLSLKLGMILIEGETLVPEHCRFCHGWRDDKCILDECPFPEDEGGVSTQVLGR